MVALLALSLTLTAAQGGAGGAGSTAQPQKQAAAGLGGAAQAAGVKTAPQQVPSQAAAAAAQSAGLGGAGAAASTAAKPWTKEEAGQLEEEVETEEQLTDAVVRAVDAQPVGGLAATRLHWELLHFLHTQAGHEHRAVAVPASPKNGWWPARTPQPRPPRDPQRSGGGRLANYACFISTPCRTRARRSSASW